MERGEVRLGAAVWVGTVFTEDLDTVEIADLHKVGEVVERILVDQRDEANHERDTAVSPLYVGVASLHQEDVEEVVPELPVRHVSEHAGQGAVPRLVDAGLGPVLQEISGNVQHVPLVPGLGVVMVAVPSLLQGVAHDEGVQGSVAQTVRLVDQFPQPVIHQQLQGLQCVLCRLLALQQEHVESRHQLCGGLDCRHSPALNEELEELDVVKCCLVQREVFVVALIDLIRPLTHQILYTVPSSPAKLNITR